MRGTQIKLVLDNASKSYYSGQVISGTVYIQLTEKKKFRGICVTFKGKAKTSWDDLRNVFNIINRRTIAFWEKEGAEEVYFNHRKYVSGSETGDGVEYPSGNSLFRFEYTLPHNLPSSFESKVGNINYSVKATIDRLWKFDISEEVPIKILPIIDLSQDASANTPIEMEMSKTFLGREHPLYVKIFVPYKGFVPEQEIPVKVSIQNKSDVSIPKIKLSLKQKFKFHAKDQLEKKVTKMLLATVSKGPFDGIGSVDYVQNLKVPRMDVCSFHFCGIIDVKFYLKVEVCLPGIHLNLKDKVEMFLGTIPVRYNQNTLPNLVPPQIQMPSPPIGFFVLPENPAGQSQPSALPSYEETLLTSQLNY